MYYIEMFIEVGNWSVRIPADRKRGILHNSYEWNPMGGSWARIGGLYTTVEAAEDKIAQYKQVEALRKTKAFRVRLL